MKAGLVLGVIVALFAGRAMAQESNVSIGRTNAQALSFDTAASASLTAESQPRTSELKIGKGLHARGPLVHLFHARTPGEVPKHFWQLINPFSRAQAPETEVMRARDLSPRAWTTVAGWHPGVSSIPAALTSPEGGGGIGLVSIGH